MKAMFLMVLLILSLAGCKKEAVQQQEIAIPNGDFEQWDSMPNLAIWRTNSCPACLPAYETYVVQKVDDAANGRFAARFIYNNVYSSFANNRFAISAHPVSLTGYVKSNIASNDTAIIHVDLLAGSRVIDAGTFYETTSNSSYRKIEIQISQNSVNADSAQIKIVGGKKQNTELFVDNLVFVGR